MENVNSHERPYWVLGVVFLVLTFLVVGLLLSRLVGGGGSGLGKLIKAQERIGVIEILGPIIDSKPTLEKIEELRGVKHIVGLILRVNSPGGAVAPSQEIYEALELYRQETQVPIYASLGTVAASGGYWIALVADRIYANAGSLTGSIGAILELVNLEALFKWLKVKHTTLKAGKYKDVGSVTRKPTLAERRMLKNILSGIHEQFKTVLTQRRGISSKKLRRIAEGQVFTGAKALKLNLVDKIGGFERTVADLKTQLGVSKETELFYPEVTPSLGDWVEVFSRSVVQGVTQAVSEKRLGL